jgi:hypothetical protein
VFPLCTGSRMKRFDTLDAKRLNDGFHSLELYRRRFVGP